MGIYHSAAQLVGHTPLLAVDNYVRTRGLPAVILAKLESFNPAGSAKDRVALEMLRQAEASGVLQPGGTVIEPTSGNTGIGLAAMAISKGYRVILTMPASMSAERRTLLKAYGAELVLVEEGGMAGAVAKAEERQYELVQKAEEVASNYLELQKVYDEQKALEEEIADLQDLVNSPRRIRQVIISELEQVKKKYALPRRTDIVYDHQTEELLTAEEEVPDYPVNLFLSREGYLKKITPQSLRMSSEQKYKDGDGPFLTWEASNRDELLVFTDRQQCYKAWLSDFDDAKASVLGDYLPTKLAMDQEERVVRACIPGDYRRQLLFFFDNGKAARVELSAYQTQTRRKKLTGAYSDKAPLVTAFLVREDFEAAKNSAN